MYIHKITHAFFHLPLDDANWGTSCALANQLQLKNTFMCNPYEVVFNVSVLGEFDNPISVEQLQERLSSVIKQQVVVYKNTSKLISKVCITAGSGASIEMLRTAKEYGCDAYICGEYKLNAQLFAKHAQLNLLVGSHTNTEINGVENLLRRTTNGCNVKTVRISEENY